jgi:hypothetical protein
MKEMKQVVWLSRVIRWTLGALFTGIGIFAGYEWYSISFGIVLFVTGFLKPVRCADEQS